MPRPKRAPENAVDKRSVSPRAFVVRAAELYITRHPTGAIQDLTALFDYAICQLLEDVGQGALLTEATAQLRAESAAVAGESPQSEQVRQIRRAIHTRDAAPQSPAPATPTLKPQGLPKSQPASLAKKRASK